MSEPNLYGFRALIDISPEGPPNWPWIQEVRGSEVRRSLCSPPLRCRRQRGIISSMMLYCGADVMSDSDVHLRRPSCSERPTTQPWCPTALQLPWKDREKRERSLPMIYIFMCSRSNSLPLALLPRRNHPWNKVYWQESQSSLSGSMKWIQLITEQSGVENGPAFQTAALKLIMTISLHL